MYRLFAEALVVHEFPTTNAREMYSIEDGKLSDHQIKGHAFEELNFNDYNANSSLTTDD